MPLTQNFSSNEDISSPNLILFSDISTGSDNSITNRQIAIQLSDGTNLVPVINWPYSDSSIQVDVLVRSIASNATVVWLAGSTVVYTKTISMEWNLYDYLFLFSLLQTQSSLPSRSYNVNFFTNSLQMIVNLFQAENAITKMGDVYSAQSALDKNFFIMQNQNDFF